MRCQVSPRLFQTVCLDSVDPDTTGFREEAQRFSHLGIRVGRPLLT